jgi:dTDP-4-dehydrorhamnose reductase
MRAMDTGIAVWGGIECSYIRVGDRYFDQLERSGLYDFPEELDRLTALGITALRFPVLWERVCTLGDRAWAWTDAGLNRLRAHGVTPIVTLLHHGSGPRDLDLTSARFPARFAAFARTVARRYPWVEYYTPINEPLTTARFATLYGLWYPHARSGRAFGRAMLVQCRAIGEAMRAIREVTPHAQLVQTEDLGKTYATDVLEYQAEFENERRWLTFDLLLGRVTGDHPIAHYLRWAGVRERELAPLAERPCPPDIVGINHYLTSERFLDHRLTRYPAAAWGGNGHHRYADVEAVRVLGNGVAGPYEMLRETWRRYRLPIAVTEAQLACTREQQIRWLAEVWNAATRLRREGGDLRAVTAWSAFGAFDWSSLLTRDDGQYEPGLFDIRAPHARPTLLAHMVKSLANCGTFDHPVLNAPGWWRCHQRLAYPVAVSSSPAPRADQEEQETSPSSVQRNGAARPVLIVGAHGTLGRAVARACAERGLTNVAVARADLDVTDYERVAETLSTVGPWCVVNCAGFVRVDDAECQSPACRSANVDGAGTLARACAETDTKLVAFSTDLVFDGEKTAPYVESDEPRPLSEYGRAKADAEVTILATAPGALVVRTAAFFDEHDDYNFVTRTLRALIAGDESVAASDVVVSPTYVPDLVHAVLDLALDNERGLWHLTSDGALTWEELARRAARMARVSAASLRGVPLAELRLAAARPKYSALTSERGWMMPTIDHALARYARSRAWERTS